MQARSPAIARSKCAKPVNSKISGESPVGMKPIGSAIRGVVCPGSVALHDAPEERERRQFRIVSDKLGGCDPRVLVGAGGGMSGGRRNELIDLGHDLAVAPIHGSELGTLAHDARVTRSDREGDLNPRLVPPSISVTRC